MSNTRLELGYSCSSAKYSVTVVLAGAITPEQIQAITAKLIDGYQIIAPQVGLPSPLEAALDDGSIPSYDDTDQPLTNLSDWECTVPGAADLHTSLPPTVEMDIGLLTQRIESVAWDQMGETDRLGIPEEDPDYEDRPPCS